MLSRRFLGELEDYVKLYKPGDQRSFHGPHLASFQKSDTESIDDVLETGVSGIQDERYQLAAFHLLVNPELRTSNLTARSAAAASAFGVASDRQVGVAVVRAR